MEYGPETQQEHIARLSALADELDRIQMERTKGQGDVIMKKLIARLRAGDEYAAKVFIENEMDKFDQYRKDAAPKIIEILYGGSGSPWFSIERDMKKKQQGDK
jgi:hypothetical protein